jgi:lipoprotein-anchoring transpeptidase ErfK/SrfK
MGISAPGVGMHGTPNPASIGYSQSHGCIRMKIPDAEWLFEHVRVGATVFIVPA